MIYFVCALYYEAAPVIEAMGLKKNNSCTRFQLFESERARLILSGSGTTKSAIAASFLFTTYPPSSDDIAVNLGICGIASETVSFNIYLCHQITDTTTGHTYYPDMIWKHPFEENAVCTIPSVISSTKESSSCFSKNGQLFDMEASGFFQACQHFFFCHQIIVLKIPSDNGTFSTTPADVKQLIAGKIPSILSWLASIQVSFSETAADCLEERVLFQSASEKLFLSETMKHRFFQLLHYYKLEHRDIYSLLQSILTQSKFITNRREGKQYFEQLTDRLIH